MSPAIRVVTIIMAASSLSACAQITAASAVVAALTGSYQVATQVSTGADRALVETCMVWSAKRGQSEARIAAGTVEPAKAEAASWISRYGEAMCLKVVKGDQPAGDPLESAVWLLTVAAEMEETTR